jgi:predicted Zn-dependent peptidase
MTQTLAAPASSQIVEHTLPNGLRIVCEVMPRVCSAALGFFVKTGSRHEAPSEHGVSHFLEHMCFKGTPRRTCQEINVRFDELGSIYNAFTGKEHTVYYGWVPAARMEPQLELLADIVRPALPDDDFETERNVILEEIAMSGDSFEHHVWNFLHEAAFPGHALAHEILGEKESIEKLPRDVMARYHARRYAPDNMMLLASGAIQPEEVFSAAARFCATWPRASDPPKVDVPPPLRPGVQRLKLPQFKQHIVILAYPGVAQDSPHAESIEAFTSLFGGMNSRCYWNIVQKGVCSQAGAAWISYADCGVMALYADGEPEKHDEMRAALEEQAKLVMSKGFTDAEVQRVKNRRRTQLALEAENPRTRLMQILDDLETLGYVRSAQARLADVEKVTRRSISEYLEQFPITGEPLAVTCGPTA